MDQLIQQATDFLKGKIRNTPTEYSPELSKLLGQPAYLKLENLQTTHFVLPMGGGGLSAGFSWRLKSQNPNARMIICQLADSAALKLSLVSYSTIQQLICTRILVSDQQ